MKLKELLTAKRKKEVAQKLLESNLTIAEFSKRAGCSHTLAGNYLYYAVSRVNYKYGIKQTGRKFKEIEPSREYYAGLIKILIQDIEAQCETI